VAGWDFQERHAAQLASAIPGLEVRVCRTEADFVAALPEAQIALVWRFRQEWVPHAYNLRLLVTPAAGRDYFDIDLPSCVTVAYGQFHGGIMGETVVGMLLAMCRGILPAADLQRDHLWPRGEVAPTMRRLRGSHVVILGFGHIGRHIGHLLKPFGVRLTGVRRRKTPPPPFFGSGDRLATLAELDEVLPAADHLVLCLPGTPETDGILDRRRLGLLRPTATLCNVGRGNAIDEEALAEALRSGRLAGACLDVFRVEPLPADSPLRACPNVWLMPHASAIAPDYLDLFVDELAQRWHSGELRFTACQ
jgi:phosphoglycerate dehydrogenase-like enzyme